MGEGNRGQAEREIILWDDLPRVVVMLQLLYVFCAFSAEKINGLRFRRPL